MKKSHHCHKTMLVARVLIGALFLYTAYGKFAGMEGTIGYIASVNMAAASILGWAAAILELVAGLAIILGIYARWSALALAVFLTIVNLIFHLNFSDPMQVLQFFKNFAIVGGLLMVMACGAGSKCLMDKCEDCK